MNDLPTRIRAHLQTCAPCLNFNECEAGALLFARSEFEARRRFLLWLVGIECIFIPVADRAWHVRFAFNVGQERARWLTRHYTGNPPGSITSFEQAVDYARLMLPSANEDLCDYMRGIRPADATAMPRKDD